MKIRPNFRLTTTLFVCFILGFLNSCDSWGRHKNDYQGRWVEGEGNIEMLKLIDQAFESMQPSSQMANGINSGLSINADEYRS